MLHRLILIGLVIGSVALAGATLQWTVSSTGLLVNPQQSGMAAMLDDGNVLVFGDAGGVPPELYDATNGLFLPISSVDAKRSSASGTRLADGRVLIVGGTDGSIELDTAAAFKAETRTIDRLPSRMSIARVRPLVVQLADNRVLIAGGQHNGLLALTAELFDPETDTFSGTGPMAAAHLGTATLLRDGRVLVAGGETAAGAATDFAELFDPASGSFSPTLTPMRAARRGHQATLLADGRVLLTGGYGADGVPQAAAETFDPVTGLFTKIGPLTFGRADHNAVLLPSGSVLIVGGRDATATVASAEIYSADTGLFTPTADLLEPRWCAAATTLADGRTLIVGGRGAAGVLASAEIYRNVPVPAKADSTTTLTASVASSTYGQPVTYEAAASGGTEIPAGAVDFVANGTTLLATAPVNPSGVARITVTTTPAGTPTITARYSGSPLVNPSESAAVTESVQRAHANGTVTMTPAQRQYSDRVTLVATVSPPTAAQSVTFKIGAQVLGTAPVVAGTATLDTQLLGAVGIGVRIVSANFNQSSPNYEIYPATRSVVLVREDARVEPVPPRTVYTGCSTCSTTTLHLEATVYDMTYVSPATDPDAGDIGTANVSFVNRATGAVIQTVPVIADSKDRRKGKATADWTVNIGRNASQTFTIGVVVGNYYIRNSTMDDQKITVVKK